MDGYYAFMLVATALVMLMTVPALALFYGGMSRAKSVLNMLMMSYVAAAVVGLVYVLWGWSMSFSDDELLGGLFSNPFTHFGLTGVGADELIYVCFQMTFAIITAALISGAIADRVKLSAWVVFLPIWVTLCYFPLAHMVFGLGYLHSIFPAQDYAGGTVVHINAGVAGGVLALIIGKRHGFGREPMKPHNLPLTMIGAGLLWFGWYGFNVGSIVFLEGDGGPLDTAQFMTETGVTFLNTTIATMAALLAWLAVEKILHGKASALGAASGIVAGLVAITPACGAVEPVGAIAIGALSGAVCSWAVGLKYRFGFDDSYDVVGVHLVGGIIGTVLIGLFSSAAAPGGIDGLLYGGGLGSLGDQAGAAGFAIIWTGVLTALIAVGIRYTIGWRIDQDDEVEGIDFAEHGESAYDIATNTGSSHF
ncbi:MAG: ammonium transporter [Aeromicrobium sp.]|uniref:ammonium transporter n=1 Tax=Aeromicrobium sp. TaxID=1871063 RepID=UPI0025C31F8C|nr:ammonium transporter [Aeromicrobium sp.]MCK5890718.1 ammonium transporter [Aeromicrobium sp.]MDF1703313.1 ammonium transporter [Aeromicrobium sp.]